MDLKKRLARLDNLGKAPGRTAPAPAGPVDFDPAPVLAGMGLALQDNGGGEFWVRDVPHERPACPGKLPSLAGFFSRAKAPWPDAREILFLDTETTGLAGGTGTLAFLVGVAWWQVNTFRTRQYFLAGPRQEAAMLKELSRLGEDFRVLMTFNGASFDLPLLRTRYVLNRLRPSLIGLQSWDLLVPARRLWGRTLTDCRQQTLETGICGLERSSDDIAGNLIPAAWFDFLREGRAEPLERVLYHNQQDLIGMATLFQHILQVARERISDPGGGDELSWQEAWSLGRISEARGEAALAGSWFGQALNQVCSRPGTGLVEPRFVKDAIRICKRTTSWDLVAKAIQGALGEGLQAPWLHREAAILYEHRLVDLESALDHALLTGENTRINRLRRRLAGSQVDS